MGGDLPGAVLFCCSQNSVRSPMAERLMKHFYGHRVYVDSCGLRARDSDGFAIAVMDELGMDLTTHRPKTFDDLEDTSFDLVISLSPEAHHSALELTRSMAIEAEYWPTLDPSAVDGSRAQILSAYRGVRDSLEERITARFGKLAAPGV